MPLLQIVLVSSVVVCCYLLVLVLQVDRSSPSSENGGERYCKVGRCVFEANSMPLLRIPLAVTAVVKSIAIAVVGLSRS